MNIRRATEAEIYPIESLLALLYKGDIGQGLRALVPEYLESPNHAVFLADGEPEVLGVLIGSRRLDIDWECRAALIDAVVVSETSRGQGIGKALVKAFCDWAREQGCSILQVVNPNEGFFASLGLIDRKACLWQVGLDKVKT